MRKLPFDLRFALAGKRVRLVHGSPRKVNEYLFCDVLVFGDTQAVGGRENR